MQAIRAAREEQAKRALRGLPVEDDSEDEEETDDEDVPEAEDLTAHDEKLAALDPTGMQNRYEKAKAKVPSDVPAVEGRSGAVSSKPVRQPLIPAALRAVWSAEILDREGEKADNMFCVRHSPDDTLVAAGCGDGEIRVLQADGGKVAYVLADESSEGLPTTCIRFRPTESASGKTRNVLLAANSDGTIKHWHITSKRCLHTITEPNNQVYALDYASDGSRFASAGRDCTVRVYDEATKSVTSNLCSSWDRSALGHSNRVFSLKYDEAQRDVLLSGGWDNTVQVWDIRAGKSVLSVWGAHVCGDAIDVHGHELLTGSWRPDDQLQLWDLRNGKQLDSITWGEPMSGREECQLYGAQFSKHGGRGLIAAAGSGANELRVFSRDTKKALGAVTLPKGVYAIDMSHNGKTIAAAAGDSTVRVFSMPSPASGVPVD